MGINADQALGLQDVVRAQIIRKNDGKLEAPPNIVTTPTGARAIYYKFRSEHLQRIALYAQIEGLIAGNPPYNPVDLEKHGLGHISNFNNLDGRSLIERAVQAYWNLLNQAEFLVKFSLRGIFKNNPEWADTLSQHFTDILREWPSFYTFESTKMLQLVKLGISPIIWPDERNWQCETVELSRFFVEDQCPTNVAKQTSICVESVFTAQYLFEVYNSIKDLSDKEIEARDIPWNKNELENLLLFKANTYVKTDFNFIDMMDLQRRLQNGDVSWNALYSDGLRLVSLFYTEYDGKVSHYIFDRYFDMGQFLYKASKQYSYLEEAVVTFTASPGEFTIHSNRGVGHKIFAPSQAMMQLDCSIVDAGRWASTPLLRSLSTGSKDFEAIRFYPGVPTNIGSAEFVQNNLGSNVNQLVGISQFLLQKLNYNIANSGDDPANPDRDYGSKAPEQIKQQAYREFGVKKNNVAHFYAQQDVQYREMLKKMLRSKKGDEGYEYVAEWKARCIEDGVPEQVFEYNEKKLTPWGMPRHISIRATRVAGDGSVLGMLLGLQELADVLEALTPAARKEYLRMKVIAALGPEYVPAFLPPDDPDEQNSGASLAGVENAIMQMGQSPVFSPENDHKAHIATHLALGNHLIETVREQQVDPVTADKTFGLLMPHLDEHIKYESKIPFSQQFLQEVIPAFKQLTRAAGDNRMEAVKMQQAAIRQKQQQEQAQNEALTDAARKDMVAQRDAQRADFKVNSQVERAKEASDTRAENMRETAQSNAATKRLKVQLEAPIKNIKNTLLHESIPELRNNISSIVGNSTAEYDFEEPDTTE